MLDGRIILASQRLGQQVGNLDFIRSDGEGADKRRDHPVSSGGRPAQPHFIPRLRMCRVSQSV